MDLSDHPQYDRLVTAVRDGGFRPGDELPYHQPNCYGCGPENPAGFELSAVAGDPGVVEAGYRFDGRHEGGPGVAHGGAVAAVIDDLLGRVLVRVLVVAVTAELSISYHRAVHLEEPCRLRAELIGRDGRDLTIHATLEQHDVEKVTATSRFREIDLGRVANRYERPEGDARSPSS